MKIINAYNTYIDSTINIRQSTDSTKAYIVLDVSGSTKSSDPSLANTTF